MINFQPCILPFRVSFSVLDAFNTVFDFIKEEGAGIHGFTPSHQLLMDKYDLSPGGVEVIAYLLHYSPSEITESKLKAILNYRQESSEAVLGDLKSRGFIIKRPIEQRANECCFAVKKDAHTAFMDNCRYGVAVFQDCLAALRDTPLKGLFSIKWLRRFNSSLELPTNRNFLNAADKLELFKLSSKDQMVFWAVARFFVLHFAEVFSVEEEDIDMGVIREGLGRLAKYGLVILLPSDDDAKASNEYVLSPKAAGLLFYGHDEIIRYDEVAKYANVIKCRDIEKKELFFSQDAQVEINNLRTMISQRGFARVKRILEKKQHATSIVSLLWGPPGTGKTEVVKQLALESGRDIILFDKAKVTGYGWGATEKYYRALFRAYNYIAEISENVPILLLNEADDILSRRLTRIERALDKSENAIANILLQEIENMTGILLATTNLIDNLDPAFGRRFMFKTQLVKPDASARAKIWKYSIPELTDSEVLSLAHKFDMSGAQINNVIAKRDLAELYFEGDRGYAYIVKLCEKELCTENGSKSFRPHIGY